MLPGPIKGAPLPDYVDPLDDAAYDYYKDRTGKVFSFARGTQPNEVAQSIQSDFMPRAPTTWAERNVLPALDSIPGFRAGAATSNAIAIMSQGDSFEDANAKA